jgi:hypothetical protein
MVLVTCVQVRQVNEYCLSIHDPYEKERGEDIT